MPITANGGEITGASLTFTLPENSGAGTVVAAFGGPIVHSVLSGADRSLFALDELNRLVYDGGPQDYESDPRPGFSVTVAFVHPDANGVTTLTSYPTTVAVSDVNEPPAFVDTTMIDVDGVPAEGYTFEVDEDVAGGTEIGTAAAEDPETDAVLYSLPPAARALFNIDVDGDLFLRAGKALDYETQSVHELEVTVIGTDANGLALASAPVRIKVKNVIEAGGTEVIQLGGAAAGARIGKVKFGGGETVTVLEDGNESDNFAVEGGFLVVGDAATLMAQTYALTLRAGTGETAATHTVDVKVNDITGSIEPLAGTAYEGTVIALSDSDGSPLQDAQGDALHFAGQSGPVATDYGSYAISADGGLAYTVNTAKVREDEVTDAFDVAVRDGFGGRTTQRVEITVKSLVSVGGNSTTAWEDNPWTDPSGAFAVADAGRTGAYALSVDNTAITADGTEITLRYGTLTVDRNGGWSYELDNGNAAVEALNGIEGDPGHSLTETVTVTMTRADDASTSAVDESETLTRTFDITVNGRTDYRLAAGETRLYHGNLEEDLSLHSGGESDSSDYVHIYGGSGDDVLYGMGRVSWLYGGGGDDWFIPGSRFNHFFGGNGNDVYMRPDDSYSRAAVHLGSSGDIDVDFSSTERWRYDKETGDWVSGAGGAYKFIRAWIDTDMDGVLEEGDEFDYIHQDFGFIYGGATNDRIIASGRIFNILGGGGDDWLKLSGGGQLYGGVGDDVLIGGTGRNTLHGDKGNDIFDGSRGDADSYRFHHSYRRSEPDTALHLDMTDDVKWKRDEEGDWISGVGTDFTYIRAWIDIDNDNLSEDTDEFDYLLDIEHLNINAQSGNDVITGGDGRDELKGNSGNDELNGGGGNDSLYGGAGDDILDGGDGDDKGEFSYSSATSSLTLDASATTTLWKRNDDGDWISGTGDGFIYRRIWADLNGSGVEDSGDEFDYFTNIERLYLSGGAGNDVLTGGNGFSRLYGNAGNDVLNGGNRGVHPYGGSQLYGGSGDDVLNGGNGHDSLNGGSDNDELNGGDGNDRLWGYSGNDELNGEGGNDSLYGGAGDDILDGGDGDDKGEFSYSSATIGLVLDATDPTRWKQNADGSWISGTGGGFIYQRFRVDVNNNGADAGDEFDYFTGIEKFNLTGGSGNDELTGGGGRDTLYGNSGNDVLNGGAGLDFLAGQGGDDIFVLNLESGLTRDDRDVVHDFSSGTVSGNDSFDGTTDGGNDKIRVTVAANDGDTLDLDALKTAANIRWTNDSNHLDNARNDDADINDTIIYATQDTATESDDVVLMVLQDFPEELTMAHFDVVEIA